METVGDKFYGMIPPTDAACMLRAIVACPQVTSLMLYQRGGMREDTEVQPMGPAHAASSEWDSRVGAPTQRWSHINSGVPVRVCFS